LASVASWQRQDVRWAANRSSLTNVQRQCESTTSEVRSLCSADVCSALGRLPVGCRTESRPIPTLLICPAHLAPSSQLLVTASHPTPHFSRSSAPNPSFSTFPAAPRYRTPPLRNSGQAHLGRSGRTDGTEGHEALQIGYELQLVAELICRTEQRTDEMTGRQTERHNKVNSQGI
jgi:hypothetical protein